MKRPFLRAPLLPATPVPLLKPVFYRRLHSCDLPLSVEPYQIVFGSPEAERDPLLPLPFQHKRQVAENAGRLLPRLLLRMGISSNAYPERLGRSERASSGVLRSSVLVVVESTFEDLAEVSIDDNDAGKVVAVPF